MEDSLQKKIDETLSVLKKIGSKEPAPYFTERVLQRIRTEAHSEIKRSGLIPGIAIAVTIILIFLNIFTYIILNKPQSYNSRQLLKMEFELESGSVYSNYNNYE